MNNLLPCPFCGSLAKIYESEGPFVVQCELCPAMMTHDGSSAALIEMWNARNAPPTPASLRSLAEWFDDPKNPHVFVEKLGKTAGYLIRQVAEAQERS